jgi:hypothetical protein
MPPLYSAKDQWCLQNYCLIVREPLVSKTADRPVRRVALTSACLTAAPVESNKVYIPYTSACLSLAPEEFVQQVCSGTCWTPFEEVLDTSCAHQREEQHDDKPNSSVHPG